MNRRKLLQTILGAAPAAALLKSKPTLALPSPKEVKALEDLSMPAQAVPPCIFEVKRATDGVLLFSAPLHPEYIQIMEPGDEFRISVNIRID